MEKPRGWEGLSRKGQPSWEKGVVGNLAKRRLVAAATERETRACGHVDCLLIEIFPSGGRSG